MMSPRETFERELKDLRDEVVKMGLMVSSQVDTAWRSFATMDTELAKQVIEMDHAVNTARFTIEDLCFKLIVTQQPAARDLRNIMGAVNLIIDLERIGDKAKDIANTIPSILKAPNRRRPTELMEMAPLVRQMLDLCIQAYGSETTELLQQIADQDKELDRLFIEVVNQTIEDFAKATKEKKVTATFGILRAAQHLERIGDLVTNVAERIMYVSTGSVQEIKTHQRDSVD
ncbi:MAG TPA: phosphate signaling complex protein PhoU [Aggregatilineaceae bacterium]|nr:phosphate signaling complex protein PhoU [Aggregatilineaceae bacterium]